MGTEETSFERNVIFLGNKNAPPEIPKWYIIWFLAWYALDCDSAPVPIKRKSFYISPAVSYGPTYLELPLRQWGASIVYLLVLSSWKLDIAQNPIAVMGL